MKIGKSKVGDSMENMIEAKGLVHEYSRRDENGEITEIKRALDGVDIQVKAGDFIAVLGANGSGKSTFAKHLNALLIPTEGTLFVNGMDTSDYNNDLKIRQTAGMVFQNPDNQIISNVVEEDVGFGPENVGVPTEEIWQRVEKSLKTVGMYSYRKSSPNHLSGGQKQRVGIARALASDPKVLLCDEATSALDPQTTKSILDLLKDINKRLNLTIVMITHQMEVVKEVCDRVAVIENGEIIEEGSMIDVFTDPQKPTTKDFVKSINNIELPALLQSSSISAVYTEGSKLIVRLSFIGNSAGDPIVSGMVKKFDVDINIIYGNIDSLKDIPFGTLVIEISGSAAGIKNALHYLHEQQLKVEVIGYVS